MIKHPQKKPTKKTSIPPVILLVLGLMMGSVVPSQAAGVNGETMISNQITQEDGRRAQEKATQGIINRQAENYRRHFLQGRYTDPSLQAYQQQLNQRYNAQLRQEIEQIYRQEKTPPVLLSDLSPARKSELGIAKTPFPFILRTNVEFNNETVERYKKGQIDLQEIYRHPEKHMMSVDIKLYGFIDPNAYIPPDEFGTIDCNSMEEAEKYNFPAEYLRLNRLCQDYVDAEVEYVNLHFREYDNKVLQSKDLASIKQQPDIDLFLKDHWRQIVVQGEYFEENCYNYRYIQYIHDGLWCRRETMYPDDKDEWRESVIQTDEWIEKALRELKEKYNQEFYWLGNYRYAPVDHPQLYFDRDYYIVGEYDPVRKKVNLIDGDHYTSAYAQYQVGEEVSKIIREMDWEGKVVAFVHTAPNNSKHTEYDTSQLPYDFGKPVDPEEFLKSYTGDIDVNLLYLKTPGEGIDYPKLRELVTKVQQLPIKWTVERNVVPRGQENFGEVTYFGFRDIFLSVRELDQELIPIINHLFERDRLSVHKEKAKGFLSEVFADLEVKKIETQGFHILDMFATEELLCSYFFYYEADYVEKYPEKTMEEFFEDERWNDNLLFGAHGPH